MSNDTPASKACTKCGEVKPLGEFYKKKHGKYGVRADCKVCRADAAAAYYEANKDKSKASQQAYYEANKDKKRAYKRAYRKANPEKFAEFSQRRRARKRANGVYKIIDKDLRRIYASPCAACGTTGKVQADHVIPIARGGHHSIGNLQPLCGSCNTSKCDRLMIEWMTTRRSA